MYCCRSRRADSGLVFKGNKQELKETKPDFGFKRVCEEEQTVNFSVFERQQKLSFEIQTCFMYVWSSHTYYSKSMDQSGKRLSILLVVSWTGKMNISLSPFAP